MSRNEMWNRLFGSGALSRDPTGQTSRQLRKVDNWCFLNCVWLMGERKPHTKNISLNILQKLTDTNRVFSSSLPEKSLDGERWEVVMLAQVALLALHLIKGPHHLPEHAIVGFLFGLKSDPSSHCFSCPAQA